MQATHITMRNMRRSTALASRIRARAESLERFHPAILGCSVSVERSQARADRGPAFEVHVQVRIPGRELVANRKHDDDVYVAVKSAFDALRRQLVSAAATPRDLAKTAPRAVPLEETP